MGVPETDHERFTNDLVNGQIEPFIDYFADLPFQFEEEPLDFTSIDRAMTERFPSAPQEVSVTDHSALLIDLLVKERDRLTRELDDAQLDLKYAREDLENYRAVIAARATEYAALDQENGRLIDEKWRLMERIRLMEEPKREAEMEAVRQAQRERLAEQWKSTDPIALLPSMKGWTNGRKLKLVRETLKVANTEGKIPAIKFAREQFVDRTGGGLNASGTFFGLKEAKDFVECILAQEV